MVIVDEDNDIDMIKYAGCEIALLNSLRIVKKFNNDILNLGKSKWVIKF